MSAVSKCMTLFCGIYISDLALEELFKFLHEVFTFYCISYCAVNCKSQPYTDI